MKKVIFYILFCFGGVITVVTIGYLVVEMAYKVSVGVGPFGELTGIDIYAGLYQVVAFFVDVPLGVALGSSIAYLIIARRRASCPKENMQSTQGDWPPPPTTPEV